MASANIQHTLDKQQAAGRLKGHVGSYARQYGLSITWSGDDHCRGERTGVKIQLVVREGLVVVSVKTSWYVPVSERQILDGVAAGVQELLAA